MTTKHIGPYGVRVVHGYGKFAGEVVYMLIRSDDSGEIMVAYSGNREMMMGLAKRLNKRALDLIREVAKEAERTTKRPKSQVLQDARIDGLVNRLIERPRDDA